MHFVKLQKYQLFLSEMISKQLIFTSKIFSLENIVCIIKMAIIPEIQLIFNAHMFLKTMLCDTNEAITFLL